MRRLFKKKVNVTFRLRVYLLLVTELWLTLSCFHHVVKAPNGVMSMGTWLVSTHDTSGLMMHSSHDITWHTYMKLNTKSVGSPHEPSALFRIFLWSQSLEISLNKLQDMMHVTHMMTWHKQKDMTYITWLEIYDMAWYTWHDLKYIERLDIQDMTLHILEYLTNMKWLDIDDMTLHTWHKLT